MPEPKPKRTTVTLAPETADRLRHFQARLIGERGDPALSMDEAVGDLLCHIESCPEPVVRKKKGAGS